MSADGGPIVVGNTCVDEGTAIYDTDSGSVLWVVLIGGASVALEPAAGYDDELLLSAERFKSRVAAGRFQLESGASGVVP